MSSLKYLSFPLCRVMPAYGGMGGVKFKKIKSIAAGDSANVYEFTMSNHCGTHVDAPQHFFRHGKPAISYPPAFWSFKCPHIVTMKLRPSEVVQCGEWIDEIDPQADIVLFKSGWGKIRNTKIYRMKNPGIDPEVGRYLRRNFPNIRAIGIDWISVSPYQDRDLGRQSHRELLNPKGRGNPVLIIEDMKLSYDLSALKELSVYPMLLRGLDSAPCTIVGVFDD